MSSRDLLPRFSGTMKYECVVTGELTGEITDPIWLDLGQVYEIAQVWVNGQDVGVKLCAPYVWNIACYWKQGENEVTIEVTNTLAKNQQDWFSKFVQQEPSGLLGPVNIIGSSAISQGSGE